MFHRGYAKIALCAVSIVMMAVGAAMCAESEPPRRPARPERPAGPAADAPTEPPTQPMRPPAAERGPRRDAPPRPSRERTRPPEGARPPEEPRPPRRPPAPPRPRQSREAGRRDPGPIYEIRYTPEGILLFASSDKQTHYSTRGDEEFYERAAAGTVVIVPRSAAGWSGWADIAAGTFGMAAHIELPPTILSSDVADIHVVFNDAVDRSTVSVDVDPDVTLLTVEGQAAQFAPFGDIALRMVVVEKQNGVALIERLDVSLKAVVEGMY